MLDFFLNRANYKTDKPALESFNWGAIIGVVAGALVGNFVKWGIASVNAMAVACVCYLVYTKVLKK